MMIERRLKDVVLKTAKGFPVLTITGPRQSGKSTLVRSIFTNYKYLSLEDPDIRDFAINDPRQFIKENPGRIIIDEFQKAPELTSYLQSHIDKVNEPGMYILTGSNQFVYMQQVTQSLAGRSAIFRLLPFSYNEIYSNKQPDLFDLLVRGFYPRMFDQNLDHQIFYSSYFDTYIQRDVRMVQNIKNLKVFENFVRLCAGRTGRILNLSNLAIEVGVTHKTIKEWLSILEAGFIIDQLPSYHKNFSKRIIKSPKLYFTDTGLVCYLLGIKTPEQLSSHPLRGEIFETYIYSELLKSLYNRGMRSNLYFYRNTNGREVDFVLETGSGLVAVEVKLNSTPRQKMFSNLDYFKEIADFYKKGYLIYTGSEKSKRYGFNLIGYRDTDLITRD